MVVSFGDFGDFGGNLKIGSSFDFQTVESFHVLSLGWSLLETRESENKVLGGKRIILRSKPS